MSKVDQENRTPFRVEVATPADVAAIAALLCEDGRKHCIPVSFGYVQQQLAQFLIARDDAGRVVGCVRIMPHGNGHVELRSLVVSREARGTGLGAQLVEAVVEQVSADNRELLCATTSPGFFIGLGFVPCPGAPVLPVRSNPEREGTRVVLRRPSKGRAELDLEMSCPS